MSTEEKPQVPKYPQNISLEETQETPSESSQKTLSKESEEAPAEIGLEPSGCDGPNSHKWANKMEVHRILSGKPDLEIKETPEVSD